MSSRAIITAAIDRGSNHERRSKPILLLPVVPVTCNRPVHRPMSAKPRFCFYGLVCEQSLRQSSSEDVRGKIGATFATERTLRNDPGGIVCTGAGMFSPHPLHITV